jgi:hypothetical protein
MRIYVRLSLVAVVACSSAGSPELFREVEPPITGQADTSESSADVDAAIAILTPELPADTPGARHDAAPATQSSGELDDEALEPPDRVAPSLTETYPANGASGVRSETEVVLTFSEAMDQELTFATLRAEGLPIPARQQWHDQGRRLQITPELPLEYAAGDATIPPRTYEVSFAEGASDAAGNALSPQAFSFGTLRRVTRWLTPILDETYTGFWRGDGNVRTDQCGEGALCVGDEIWSDAPETAAQYRAFLSFDLSVLPEQMTELVAARLHVEAMHVVGDPFGGMGQLHLERAVFGEVGQAAFDAPPQATFGVMTGPALGASGENILWAVQADLDAQALHQYRLSFDRSSNRDGTRDVVVLSPAAQLLELTYLMP